MSISDVLLDAELKNVSRISLSTTPFCEWQRVKWWRRRPS